MNDINQMIDHTLLKPEASWDEIQKVCRESIEYQFASACIPPIWVKRSHELLKGTSVKVCTVVGFPLGANTTECKAAEAAQLHNQGAQELDMVLCVGALKSKDYDTVRKDIEAVVNAAPEALVKVIIETGLLTDEEKKIACRLAVEAGAHFVKTSTGFSKTGASVHDIVLMRSIVGPDIGVKASGGIRDVQTALDMLEAGATRIGTSCGVSIIKELIGKTF
jgi:deoxyribose-phosphate aldolase